MKPVVCRAQLRLVFKNIKLLFLIFMTVLVSFTWLFYSQKDEYKHNREKTQCVEWALDSGDPQKAVEDAVNDLVMNAGTVNLRFADSFYDEYMLYTEAGEHLKKTLGYRNEIENVIAAKKGQLGFAENKGEKEKYLTEIKYYSKLLDNKVQQSGYLGFEGFFEFDVLDVCILIVIFLLCSFLVVQEREKGLGNLIYATERGGSAYFVNKYAAIAFFTAVFSILIFSLKLLLYCRLYPVPSFDTSVQSMPGYFAAPFKLSLGGFILIYFIWKIAVYSAVAGIICVICSLKLSEAGAGVVSFLFFLISFALSRYIPSSSKWVLLRDISLIRIASPDYWIKALRIYILFSSKNRAALIYGPAVPAVSCAVLFAAVCAAGVRIYLSGLKKSSDSADARVPSFSYRYSGNGALNEFFYCMFKKKALAALLILIFVFAAFVCDKTPDRNVSTKNRREMAQILNSMSFDESKEWLKNKNDELEGLQNSLIQMQVKYSMGEITEREFNEYSSFVYMQLGIRETLNEMIMQSEDMETFFVREGIDTSSADFNIRYEVTDISDSLFSNSADDMRIWIFLFVCIFVIFFAAPLLPGEIENGIYPLAVSSEGGAFAALYRCFWLLVSCFVMCFVLMQVYVHSLGLRFGAFPADYSYLSIGVLRKCFFLPQSFTVKEFVSAEILMFSLRVTVAAEIMLIISSFINKTVVAEIAGTLLLFAPPLLRLLDIELAYRLKLTYFTVFGDFITMSSLRSVVLWPAIFVFVSYILFRRVRKWAKLE